jgi:hypothetical protein
MDINQCWVEGQRLAAWLDLGKRGGPTLTFQANGQGFQALTNLMSVLAREPAGSRITLDNLTGLQAGDCYVVLEHSQRFERPPQSDLHDTQVEPPDEGDTVLWMKVPENGREEAAKHLVAAGRHTVAQAREVVSRRHAAVRMNAITAARLLDVFKKLGATVEVFKQVM